MFEVWLAARLVYMVVRRPIEFNTEHYERIRMLRKSWPVLWEALDKLLRAVNKEEQRRFPDE